jgi:hypothetical protein
MTHPHELSEARPSRRTVVRTAAWSVPVISVATAAPAFAASPCSDTYSYRLAWGTTSYAAPTSAAPNRGVATVPASPGGGPGAQSITVTLQSTFQGTTTAYDGNLTVLPTTGIGGLVPSQQGVAIRSTTNGGFANTQTVAITFGRAVSNLSFSVVDLDRAANFNDRASFSPAPSSYTRAATVGGIGAYSQTETSASTGAFRYTGSVSTGLDDTSPDGVVTVNYAGGTAFTTFQLIYWSTQTPGPQGILLSDFSFNAKGC